MGHTPIPARDREGPLSLDQQDALTAALNRVDAIELDGAVDQPDAEWYSPDSFEFEVDATSGAAAGLSARFSYRDEVGAQVAAFEDLITLVYDLASSCDPIRPEAD